jgi:diaminopimelate epimerase
LSSPQLRTADQRLASAQPDSRRRTCTAAAVGRYRIFNSDGGEVEQCGNGARCFVKFVHDEHLTEKPRIRVETLGGIIAPQLEPSGEVTVDMGPPVFDPASVPFDTHGLEPSAAVRDTLWPLTVHGRVVMVSVCRWAIRTRCKVTAVDDAL